MRDAPMLELFSDGQEYGARFLASRRIAMLADRAGYGKTAQLIRGLDYVGAQRVTWVCPPQLTIKAIREYRQWSLWDLPAVALESSKDPIPNYGIVTVSYDLARRPEVAKRLRDRGCDALVFDEAHKLKDRGGATSKAFFLKKGIASTAGRLWLATASPAQNNASEWYGFARLCGAWTGNFNAFVDRFCVTVDTEGGPKIVGNKNEVELMALLAPYVLCREKAPDDVRGGLIVDEIYVDGRAPDDSALDPTDLADVRQALDTGDWSIIDRPSVSTVRRIVGDAKFSGVGREAIQALRTHRKVLIFCQHTGTIDGLANGFSYCGVTREVLDGRTKKKSRQKIIDDFQTAADPRVLICHGRSAGEGLDLIAATRVLLAEPSWNPEDNKQMIARAWRRGQKHNVHASFCTLRGTIDEAVNATNARKTREMAKIDMAQRTPGNIFV